MLKIYNEYISKRDLDEILALAESAETVSARIYGGYSEANGYPVSSVAAGR